MYIDGRNTKLCKRFNDPGDAHELTFSCYKNQNFLKSRRVCQWLAQAIERAKESCGFDLWAYVFMPNHVHMVICPRSADYSIPAILKAIKTPVGVQAIAHVREHHPASLALMATGQEHRSHRFWQKGGGYDRNITNIDTLIKTLRYIHANPVRKNLVTEPHLWPYSSAAQWQDLGDGILKIDRDRWPVP